MLLKNPIPTPPGDKDNHSPVREADTIRSLDETFRMFAKLVEYLESYEETDIVDANGQALRILAQLKGQQDVGTPVDFSLKGSDKLELWGGTVSDLTDGGTVWTPSGLTLGKYTDISPGSSGVAYLIITYDESLPTNITSVTYDTASSTPANASGTLYFELGAYNYSSGVYTVLTTPKGSLKFKGWKSWFVYPASYEAECY